MTWSYQGPVLYFGRCIVESWSAFTSAPSEAKAKSNLTYRFKKENGYSPTTRISLPGEVKMEVKS